MDCCEVETKIATKWSKSGWWWWWLDLGLEGGSDQEEWITRRKIQVWDGFLTSNQEIEREGGKENSPTGDDVKGPLSLSNRMCFFNRIQRE